MTTLNSTIQVRRGTAAQMPTVLLVGELYFQTDTSKLYSGTGTGVVQVSGSGGGVWGTITGTLSNQTDLESALTTLVTEISTETNRAEAAEALLAPLASPTFTGTVSGITAAMVGADVSGAAATAQSNAESFATSSVATETSRAEAAEALLAPLASPALTGTPTAPTKTALTNNTDIATTAYADAAVAVETSRATTAEATKQATLTGTGLARNTGVCTELSGDVTTSGSNLSSVVKVNGVAVPTSKTVVGTNSSGQIIDASSATLSNNTSGTAANLSGTPALPNGTTATTQAALSADTKLATDAYVDSAVGVEKTRALAAEALLAPLASPTFTGTVNATAIVISDTAANADLIEKNTTTGTAITTNASPLHEWLANYYTGSISAVDTWAIGSSLAAGTNGVSTLSLTHSGSTGTPVVALPAKANLQISDGSSNPCFLSVSSTVLRIGTTANGSNVSLNCSGINVGSGAGSASMVLDPAGATFNVTRFTTYSGSVPFGVGNGSLDNATTWSSTTVAGWSSAANVHATLDNGISRLGAGSLAFGNGAALDTTASLSFGKTIKYNGTATVRNGQPAEYASSDLTSQSAAITATTLLSAPQTGMYRVSWSADITTASDISSVLGGAGGFEVLYTSPTDSVVKTTVAGNSVTSAANTTGTAVGGVIVVYAKTGTNIQYTFGYTDSHTSTAMQYELHITVEAL